ncbi:hypothetical protein FNV43_RR14197 [Rhamnella rubrinervis]|uniref:Uncharacterized protein n=1 Tax=Rhamnella rubrinervis TaxID=2594499 RepID=A0A8K0H2J6_9ROSA|nr:hypothetical protein FNV43_RR14197 [Rhamnella rubrinervis]
MVEVNVYIQVLEVKSVVAGFKEALLQLPQKEGKVGNAVAMSDSVWDSQVKNSVALEPTPPPSAGTGDGGSAAAEFNPHLFTTPFLLPIIICLSALF